MIDDCISPDGEQETFEAWEVALLFNILCDDYHKGKLTLDDFRSALKDLMLQDIEGNLWTIGAKSGNWYRRVGNEWVVDKPSGPLVVPVQTTKLVKRESKTFEAKRTQSAEIQAVKSPSEATGVVKCPNCGRPLPKYASFCPNCESPIVGRRDEYCTKCGAQLPEGIQFCTKCGAPVKGGKQ